jgi:hypothetical protein
LKEWDKAREAELLMLHYKETTTYLDPTKVNADLRKEMQTIRLKLKSKMPNEPFETV